MVFDVVQKMRPERVRFFRADSINRFLCSFGYQLCPIWELSSACHEGAIGIVDGKAKLLQDDYCDGLGDCLPECPTGAITFVEREAAAYNELAVMENKKKKMRESGMALPHAGCPGQKMRTLTPDENTPVADTAPVSATSQLRQWPCQIKLVPVNAPYFKDARLLVAADCTAYAYANIHSEFMRGKITLIG